MRGPTLHIPIVFILITIIIGSSVGFPCDIDQTRINSSVIEITDNQDLIGEAENRGWKGSGSPGDPFIIENQSYDLNYSSKDTGLSLSDTDLHILIRNVTISSGMYGIKCLNVSNISIEEVISEGSENGIRVEKGNNISVIGSLFDDVKTGIFFKKSSSVNITGSRISHSAIALNFLNNQDNVTVDNCEIEESQKGILVDFCNTLEIENTNLKKLGWVGVSITNSINMKMKRCNFQSFSSDAISIRNTSHLYLENCTLSDIREYPMEIYQQSSDIFVHSCDFLFNLDSIALYQTYKTISFCECNFRGEANFINSYHNGDLIVRDCQFRSNGYGGVRIYGGDHIELVNNTYVGSGVFLHRDLTPNRIKIEDNTVNGKDLIFLHDRDMTGIEISENVGQLIMFNVNGLDIANISWEQFYYGIIAMNCENITIMNNSFHVGNYGIYCRSFKNLAIDSCSFDDLNNGVIFFNGDKLKVFNCSFQDIYKIAIRISDMDFTEIVNNRFLRTDTGIYINYIQTGRVRDNRLEMGKVGVTIIASTSWGAEIFNNTITDFNKGGMLLSADGYHIWGNKLINTSFGLGDIYSREPFDLGLSENNTVNGLPIEYQYRGNMTIDGDNGKGQYIACDCDVVKTSNLSETLITKGILVVFSDNVLIQNCVFKNITGECLRIAYGGSVIISKNRFIDIGFGLILKNYRFFDLDFSIKNNLFLRNENGILIDNYAYEYYHSEIIGNIFYQCSTSLFIYHGGPMSVRNNDIIGSREYSIMTRSTKGSFSLNNFWYNCGTNLTFRDGKYQGIGCYNGRPPDLYHNYWSDNKRVDSDCDGILDDPHPVGEISDNKIYERNSLIRPKASKHLLLNLSTGNNSMNLTWKLPGYTFMGNLTSLVLHRMGPNGEDEILADVLNGPGFYNDPNLENGTNYTYYLKPTFEKGEGYPSNSMKLLHGEPDFSVEITFPENGTIMENVNVIIIIWEVYRGNNSHLYFNLRINEQDWISVDNLYQYELSYERDGLQYGINIIEIKVTDHLGFNETDQVAIILDFKGPNIEITSPNNTMIQHGKHVHFSWKVWDDFCEVSKVEVKIDDDYWNRVTHRDEYSVYNLQNGDHVFYVEAVDSLDNVARASLNFTVLFYETPIDIVYPSEGEMFNTRDITLEWEVFNREFVESTFLSLDGSGWTEIGEGPSEIVHFNSDGIKNIKVKVRNIGGLEYEDEVNISMDTVEPFVVVTSPEGDMVPVDSWISIIFSEKMDQGSVSVRWESWDGELTWIGNRTMVKFNIDFGYNEEITITVRGRDLHGNAMDPYAFTFRTTDIGYVNGRVLDESGIPIEGASIEIGSVVTNSDSNGSFHLELGEGGYRMKINKEGFLEVGLQVDVEAGSTRELGDITLKQRQKEEKDDGKTPVLTIFLIILFVLMVAVTMSVFIFIERRKDKFIMHEE